MNSIYIVWEKGRKTGSLGFKGWFSDLDAANAFASGIARRHAALLDTLCHHVARETGPSAGCQTWFIDGTEILVWVTRNREGRAV